MKHFGIGAMALLMGMGGFAAYGASMVDTLELGEFAGIRALNRINGLDRQEAYLLNYEQLAINYGENVEFQLRKELILLTPETHAILYGEKGVPASRYQKGSRPELERAAAGAVRGAKTTQEKALALMRYCRDLGDRHRQRPVDERYIYGGTEEELIRKGEVLCETLSRLFVALCEVEGIPARLVMHVIGGHICAEVQLDGEWGYLDPRFGIYFLKENGRLASVAELLDQPVLIDQQGEEVKAEVSKQTSWKKRAEASRRKFFTPEEINGFQYYQIAEAERYRYGQISGGDAEWSGLSRVNRLYKQMINRVFKLEGDQEPLPFHDRQLTAVPLSYRHDGFSYFYLPEPPLTAEQVEREMVDIFQGSKVTTLEWGLGPGSVFCYDTKVGEVFGDGVTKAQMATLRKGDLRAIENLRGLIASGHDPLKLGVKRGHALGLEVLARLEMQHEFGSPDSNTWAWIGLVGKLNKKNPQYRIKGTTYLDFKHHAVRDFKLRILEEAVRYGADGVSMDFAIYPPYFEKPDTKVMTRFVGDIRTMLDREGKERGEKLISMVRVPVVEPEAVGLDWRQWMEEKLVDRVVGTFRQEDQRAKELFDVPLDEMVQEGERHGVEVYGCLWHSLGIVSPDRTPEEQKANIVLHPKPKTVEMWNAQAMLFLYQGVKGLQIAMAGNEFARSPWMDRLGDPGALRFVNKHYMVNRVPYLPLELGAAPGRRAKSVLLRLADDLAAAQEAGLSASTELLYYGDEHSGSRLQLYVNGNGPLKGELTEVGKAGKVHNPDSGIGREYIYRDTNWWRWGEHRVVVPPEYWRLGNNVIRIVYEPEGDDEQPTVLQGVEVKVQYAKAPGGGGSEP